MTLLIEQLFYLTVATHTRRILGAEQYQIALHTHTQLTRGSEMGKIHKRQFNTVENYPESRTLSYTHPEKQLTTSF